MKPSYECSETCDTSTLFATGGLKRTKCHTCNSELSSRYLRCSGSPCSFRVIERSCKHSHYYEIHGVHGAHSESNPQVRAHSLLPLDVKELLLDNIKLQKKPFLLYHQLQLNNKYSNFKLSQVQNFVKNRKKRDPDHIISCNDMKLLLDNPRFEPYLFHSDFIQVGGDIVFIGFTSETLLSAVIKQELVNPDFTIGLDATFKLSTHKFPVMTMNLVDNQQRGHLLAVAVVSNTTIECWKLFLEGTKDAFRKAFQRDFKPAYAVMDGEAAIKSAVKTSLPSTQTILCYAHLCSIIQRYSKDVIHDSKDETRSRLDHIRDLHTTRTASEYQELLTEIINEWKKHDDTKRLLNYLNDNGYLAIDGNESRWQCFRKPPGVPATNNALESTHNKMKLLIPNPVPLNCCVDKLIEFIKDVEYETERATFSSEFKPEAGDISRAKKINKFLFIPVERKDGFYHYKRDSESETYTVSENECTCWRCHDRGICKHVLALRDKLHPSLPKVRGIGRPKKKKALERD